MPKPGDDHVEVAGSPRGAANPAERPFKPTATLPRQQVAEGGDRRQCPPDGDPQPMDVFRVILVQAGLIERFPNGPEPLPQHPARHVADGSVRGVRDHPRRRRPCRRGLCRDHQDNCLSRGRTHGMPADRHPANTVRTGWQSFQHARFRRDPAGVSAPRPFAAPTPRPRPAKTAVVRSCRWDRLRRRAWSRLSRRPRPSFRFGLRFSPVEVGYSAPGSTVATSTDSETPSAKASPETAASSSGNCRASTFSRSIRSDSRASGRTRTSADW